MTYGRERLGDLRPVTAETVFQIGSITKVFTALLLADMARRGELRLDDPVARHLPSDFHLPEFNGRQITLADLATHTSGLPTSPPFGLPMRPPFDAAALPAFFEAVSRFSVRWAGMTLLRISGVRFRRRCRPICCRPAHTEVEDVISSFLLTGQEAILTGATEEDLAAQLETILTEVKPGNKFSDATADYQANLGAMLGAEVERVVRNPNLPHLQAERAFRDAAKDHGISPPPAFDTVASDFHWLSSSDGRQ